MLYLRIPSKLQLAGRTTNCDTFATAGNEVNRVHAMHIMGTIHSDQTITVTETSVNGNACKKVAKSKRNYINGNVIIIL